MDESANDRFGAYKVGSHDDPATPLALAVQGDEPVRQVRLTWGRPRDPGSARQR